MARRADWDIDDDFEVLNVISPSSSIKNNPTTQDLFELIGLFSSPIIKKSLQMMMKFIFLF